MSRKAEGSLATVVVPVYNAERHLHECLDSINNQTYKNIEVITINDGSTDGSSEICDEYARASKNIRVIHTENQGVSAARNLGIAEAKGDYIIFVDSDDMIKPRAIEELVGSAVSLGVDVALADLIEFHTIGYQTPHTTKSIPDQKPFNFRDLDEDSTFELLTALNSPFNKALRRAFLLENNLTFSENLRIAEDLNFIAKAYALAGSISYIKKGLYVYRQDFSDTQSATGNLDEKKSLDFIGSLKDIRDFMLERGFLDDKTDKAMRRVTISHSLYALNISTKDNAVHRRVFDRIRGDLFKYFNISVDDIRDKENIRVESLIGGSYEDYLMESLRESRTYSHQLVDALGINNRDLQTKDEEIAKLKRRVIYLTSLRGALRTQAGRLRRGISSLIRRD